MNALTCGFSLPLVTTRARRVPEVAGVMRTQRGPLGSGPLLQMGLTSYLQSQIWRIVSWAAIGGSAVFDTPVACGPRH